MTRKEFGPCIGIHRAVFSEFLDKSSSGGGSVEEQRPSRLGARILPGMRNIARHERACSRTADGYFITDLESDLSSDDPGDFIAVLVEMMKAGSAGRQCLLEHHDALIGLATKKLQVKRTPRGRRVDLLPAARRYDEALCCLHVRASSLRPTDSLAPCGVLLRDLIPPSHRPANDDSISDVSPDD